MDNYIVGNIGVNDTSSNNKYAAVATSGVKEFNIPPSMNRCAFVQVGDDMVEFITQNNIAELESYEYDKEQVNNKIEALKSDVSKYIEDIVGVEDAPRTYRSEMLNDDKLTIRTASR